MKKREIHLDILRLMAMAAVIWVHVGGMESGSLPTTDPNCQWLIFLKSIMTWQIPVYVMISGRFFLDPSRCMPFSKIRKAVFRVILAFAVWNVIYQIFYLLDGSHAGLNWKGILSQALIGPYHFWYLYMIAGLYLITPFLRKIAESKQLSEYYIVLFFLFMVLNKYGVRLPFVGATLNAMAENMSMHFVVGYSGYYILGHYLRTNPLSGRWEKGLYLAGGVLLLAGAAANTWQSLRIGAYTEAFTGYTNPNTILVACAIYTLFTRRVSRLAFSDTACRLISKLSEYSFGVYLVHALVLSVFSILGLGPTILHPVLAMPLITLAAWAVSLIIVVLVRRIPVVGRKIA